MGEREKVVLIEPDRELCNSLIDLLEINGHSVVRQATSGHDIYSDVLRGDIEFTVAILDLTDPAAMRRTADCIRAGNQRAKIIGYTFNEQNFGDINLTKFDGPKALIDAVRKI